MEVKRVFVEVKEARSFGYGRIPNAFVDHYMKRIGASAVAVYVVLAKYADTAGRSYPAVATIAEIAGLSSPTVVHSLRKLQDEGLISVQERAGKSSIYIMLEVPDPPKKTEGVKKTTPPKIFRAPSPKNEGGGLKKTGGVPPQKSLDEQDPIEQDPLNQTHISIPNSTQPPPMASEPSSELVLFVEPQTTDPEGKIVRRPAVEQRSGEVTTALTWEAYTAAYCQRYGFGPLRNPTTNSQMKQFVQRVGTSIAPDLAAWYVRHQGAWYVKQAHTVGPLLKDCESLHTQWKRGQQVTNREANETDRMGATLGVIERVSARAFARREAAEREQNK